MAINTIAESLGLVINIMMKAPISMMALRANCESAVPAATFICVVSAVSRLIISPEWFLSK